MALSFRLVLPTVVLFCLTYSEAFKASYQRREVLKSYAPSKIRVQAYYPKGSIGYQSSPKRASGYIQKTRNYGKILDTSYAPRVVMKYGSRTRKGYGPQRNTYLSKKVPSYAEFNTGFQGKTYAYIPKGNFAYGGLKRQYLPVKGSNKFGLVKKSNSFGGGSYQGQRGRIGVHKIGIGAGSYGIGRRGGSANIGIGRGGRQLAGASNSLHGPVGNIGRFVPGESAVAFGGGIGNRFSGGGGGNFLITDNMEEVTK
ncbi:keratin, type I cytoskeletal 9-like [Mytilus trossulus]|uniref:keratin, type I cytoskeletal 9-like n=1 Tax=Mytilus trossulus TaxID=6551 RepID=UPI0030044E5C